MKQKLRALFLVALVAVGIILIIHYHGPQREDFTSKNEKAQAIYDWFTKNNGNPTYANYRTSMQNKSNIVEYEDVLSQHNAQTLTLESVKNVI